MGVRPQTLAELSVCFIWHEKIIKPVLCKLQYELSQCPALLLDELQLLATSRNVMPYAKYSLLSMQREKRNTTPAAESFFVCCFYCGAVLKQHAFHLIKGAHLIDLHETPTSENNFTVQQ